MKKPAHFLVLLCCGLAGCATSPLGPGEMSRPPATRLSQTSAIVERPSNPARKPIRLGELPDHGLIVSSKRSTEFLGLDGTPLAVVADVSLALNRDVPGIWFQQGKAYFRLDVEKGRLVPVTRDRAFAKSREFYKGPDPRLPLPEGTIVIQGDPVGHWRYAFRSPSGDVLGQWSGECEVPMAYWIEPGGQPQVITGEASSGLAPQSSALGWSPDGPALAWVGSGPCGGGEKPPGVYAFTAPGVRELVYPMRPRNSVEMWSR